MIDRKDLERPGVVPGAEEEGREGGADCNTWEDQEVEACFFPEYPALNLTEK